MGICPGLGLRNGGAGRGTEPLRHIRFHFPGLLAAPAPCCAHRVAAAPPGDARGGRCDDGWIVRWACWGRKGNETALAGGEGGTDGKREKGSVATVAGKRRPSAAAST